MPSKIMPRIARPPLEVVLVPLENKREIRPPRFPPMPRLYLELLENKDKIKKEFLKTEFTPKYEETITFDDEGHIIQETHPSGPSSTRPTGPSRNPPRTSQPAEKKKVPNTGGGDTISVPVNMKAIQDERGERQGDQEERREKRREEQTKGEKKIPPEEKRGEKKDHHDPDVLGDEIFPDAIVAGAAGAVAVDPLTSFLKKSRSIGSREVRQTPERKAAYEEKKEFLLHDEQPTGPRIPPSLQDLESGGAFETGGIKNVNHVSKREQDQEQKLREYLFKYDLLRRSYPNEEIPKFTIHSDPEHVARTYDDILRNLSLSDNVNKYKKWLMFGFMGTEALVGNVLGFDMKGFTKQQIIEMPIYEKTLIELGEKNYVPQSKWPVELRLLGMIIMNAAFFVAGKMALKATGTDVLGSMNAAANAGVATSNNLQRRKQQMTGPSISLDDIPLSKENPSDTKGAPSSHPPAFVSTAAPPAGPGVTFVNK